MVVVIQLDSEVHGMKARQIVFGELVVFRS